MIVALWIVNALLALATLASGGMKVARPKPALAAAGMTWADDFSVPQVKGIGTIEVVGALGLILPLSTGIAPILTPIAAVGFVVVFIGAIITHARRHEGFVPALVLLLLSIASAVLGFLVV